MKKYLLLFFLLATPLIGFCQHYPNIVSYNVIGTPSNGVKIKTNIPFQNGYSMPLIKIEGYNYGENAVLDLSIVFYIYNNQFRGHSISSSGNSTPEVKLSNEGGKVAIHLNQNVYYQRFMVSAFAKGMKEQSSDFSGWVVESEAPSGSPITTVPYRNSFNGEVRFSQGIWNSSGNVGIGTTSPANKLEVNGTVRAKEVKVEATDWPDYVFEEGYPIKSLEEVEAFIRKNNHLPDIPSEKEILEDGVELGKMDASLLQKIEELTLYTIQQQKEIDKLEDKNEQLENQINKFKFIDQQLLELKQKIEKLESTRQK